MGAAGETGGLTLAKPAYSLVYAILIAIGLVALVLFNRLLSSEDAAPAAQASLQRNEATVREARDAVAEDAEKAAAAGAAEARGDAQAPRPPAVRAEAPGAEARDEEERK